jgi:methionyl-tRNA formyltransferase
VLLRSKVPIAPDDTTATLHDKLSALGAGLIVEALNGLDDLVPEPQPEAGVTYAEKVRKDEAQVDWTRAAAEVDRHIRGLSPFPGAWTTIGGERVKLLLSQLAEGSGAPGTVLDDDLTVACGTGAVRLLRLQRAGKGPMEVGEFLRGFAVPAGTAMGG